MKTYHLSLSTALIAAFTTCSFFAVVVPLQTFLANGDFFTYSLKELIVELLLALVISWGILFGGLIAIGYMVKVRYLRWIPIAVLSFIFAIIVCGYVETGILSVWLPPLDGDMLCFMNAYLKVVDSLVLAGVFVISFFVLFLFRNYAAWMFICILVMSVASLFDVKVKEPIKAGGCLSDGFCSKFVVANSMAYSTNRNVMVFILDSMPATVASDVLTENSALAEKFRGFVSYRKNIGMHECTHRGLPGLMTGRYAGAGDTINSYCKSIFEGDTFLMPYVQAKFPTCFNGLLFEFGYTNQKAEDSISAPKVDENGLVIFRRCGTVPNLSLWDVVRFRLTPFAKKLLVLSRAIARGRHDPSVEKESELYPLLAKAKLIATPLSLGVFHTHGVHVPLVRDWNGAVFNQDVPESARLKGSVYYVLNHLGNLFKVLRERGVYDRSTIVVTADHGIIFNDHPEGEMGQKSALLMVKPEYANDAYEVSEVPTSHCNIAALMRRLCDDRLKRHEIDAILRKDLRLFRGRFKKSLMFYDWIYGPSGELVEQKEAGVFKGQ